MLVKSTLGREMIIDGKVMCTCLLASNISCHQAQHCGRTSTVSTLISQYRSVQLDNLYCTQLSVVSQHGGLLIGQPESRNTGDCTHRVSGYMPRLHGLSVLMGVHGLHQPILCIFFLLLWVCATLDLKTRMGGNVALVIGLLRIPGCCLVQVFVLKVSLRNWIILLCQLHDANTHGVFCICRSLQRASKYLTKVHALQVCVHSPCPIRNSSLTFPRHLLMRFTDLS